MAFNHTDIQGIYRTLVEQSPTPIALYVGCDMTIFMANDAMLKAYGKDKSVIGKPYREAVPEFENQPFFDILNEVYKTGVPYSTEASRAEVIIDGQLQTFYYSFDYKPLKDDEGKVWGIINTATNITQFVHSKIAVQRAEEMLRLAVESADLGTWFVDVSTRKLTASNRTKELLGYYAHENLVMETAMAQIRDDYRNYVIAAIDSAIIFGENYDIEYPIIGYHDKRLRWLRATGKLYESESGESPFLAGTVFDITAHKMHQMDVETKHRQEIFEATLITQENERKRIAESLHNSLGQLLYSIQLRLITSDLSKKSAAVGVKTDDEYTARLLDLAIRECRRISHELTPTILEDFGLKYALNDICREISDGLPVKFEFTGLNKLSDKYIEITLYRTIQELVMNIIRHAKATEARVRVEVNKTGVNLTVSDNGIGFQNYDKSHGIGLKTIQNKIKLLNGKFELTHGQDQPTLISIHIPNKADKII